MHLEKCRIDLGDKEIQLGMRLSLKTKTTKKGNTELLEVKVVQ